MATRTNEDAVRSVLSTSLDTTSVTAFIADANLWVTEELESLTDAGFTAGRLELIERYLACALIRLRDLGLKSSTMEDVSENYQVDPSVTDYLKRAASFDPTGTIQKAFLTDPTTGPTPVVFKVSRGFRCEPPATSVE